MVEEVKYVLLTSPTPNGHKLSILLEELGVSYEVVVINLSQLDQKQDWFLRRNPNDARTNNIVHELRAFWKTDVKRRIPVLLEVAPNPSPFDPKTDFSEKKAIFESGAIMWYLAKKHHKFIGESPDEELLVMQWLMFQMAGVGPMMGQANVFYRYAPEKIPFAIERYQKEGRRLLEVLNTQLKKSKEKQPNQKEFYLCGGSQPTIADFANFAWVRTHSWSGIETTALDELKTWCRNIFQRPATRRGLDVPVALKDSAKLAANIQKTGSKIIHPTKDSKL